MVAAAALRLYLGIAMATAAAAFTALAGAIFFIDKGTIYPSSGFDISWTVSMVFIVIIGGIGTVSGAGVY